MRENYKIQGATEPLQIQIEKEIFEIIQTMQDHTKLTVSELTNTALKRFISAHKDFLPDGYKKPSKRV